MSVDKTSYTYYPGCSLEGTAHDFDMSTQEVFKRLGVKLEELKDWSCCGASSAHFVDHLLSIALPARNLSLAKKQGSDSLVVSCAACFSRLKTAAHEMAENADLKADVERVIEDKYDGGVEIKHTLSILLDEIDAAKIKEAVVKPLSNLKVVPYYGCLLVRPPKVMQFDNPENPTSMDKVLEATGAKVLNWGYKTECCGASLTLSRADLVCTLTKRILTEAKDAGADVIAVACPLCQANLDMRQVDLKRKGEIDFTIPILYFTQILGLSFGIEEKKLGINRLLISASKVIKNLEAVPVAAPAS